MTGWVVIIVLLLLLIFTQCRTVYQKNIYLDANGTTPYYTQALWCYNKSAHLGNPSAHYSKAKQKITQAKQTVKQYTGADQIIFNSGASEGNNQILRTVLKPGDHLIMSPLEHKTSIECIKQLIQQGIQVSWIKSKPNQISHTTDWTNQISTAIQPNTKLISVMGINNETGALAPVQQIYKICKRNQILFHTDATQALGKFKHTGEFDFLTASAHKWGGPPGVGLLACSNTGYNHLQAIICGNQFNQLRGGTENTPGICALEKALQITHYNRVEKNNHLENMKTLFCKLLKTQPLFNTNQTKSPNKQPLFTNNQINLPSKQHQPVIFKITPEYSSPNTLMLSAVCLHGDYNYICGLKLKKQLYQQNIIIGTGSACNSITGSHVLSGMNLPEQIIKGSYRISMLDSINSRQVKQACLSIHRCIRQQIQEYQSNL